MAVVAGTVPVRISFEEEDVITSDAFYKRVTPRVEVGVPRLKRDKIKMAAIEEVIKKKMRIKLKGAK